MSVQTKLVGESFGVNKNDARNLAAADILFKLYETQPVLRVSTMRSLISVSLSLLEPVCLSEIKMPL